MKVAQIHIGAGQLGLGLVMTSARAAGMEAHLVNRTTGGLGRSPSFAVIESTVDGGAARCELEPASFSLADHVEELHQSALAAIDEADHLLITTTVTTSGVRDCQGLLTGIAQRRGARRDHRGAGADFIACENDPGPHFKDLTEALAELGVRCLPTVVDRLCAYETDTPDLRVVRADAEADWAIEAASPSPGLAALADGAPHVRLVDDVTPLKQQKLWLVNGAHLALGIWARRRGLVFMRPAAGERGRVEWLEALLKEMSEPLLRLHPELGPESNCVEWGSKHIEAWLRETDETRRILKRLRRSDVGAFLDDFDLKFGSCARKREGGPTEAPCMRSTLENLHALLTDLEKYEDFRPAADSQDAPLELDAAKDAAAVERYRAILGGALGLDAVALAEDLDAAFEAHRARFE